MTNQQDLAEPRRDPLGIEATALERRLEGDLETFPDAVPLEVGPEPGESPEKKLATGPEIDGEDLEASIRGAMPRSRGEPRIEVAGLPRPGKHKLRVPVPELSQVGEHPRRHHV